ncbi:hypothetical protein GOP47_0016526 [Adiantum capillus-veneris]|uniref:Uncharacterized protein n=1 Tax=Adiantum capillus-veneris TaxID=13818 RepID=A0A9D4UHU8_ADICA|nr:hypothetical protein GOP47_0016526 [Adiantum capillus-veneris]
MVPKAFVMVGHLHLSFDCRGLKVNSTEVLTLMLPKVFFTFEKFVEEERCSPQIGRAEEDQCVHSSRVEQLSRGGKSYCLLRFVGPHISPAKDERPKAKMCTFQWLWGYGGNFVPVS